ncbi:MAG: nucleotidyltransferase family protein [Acidobacteriota bacterium]
MNATERLLVLCTLATHQPGEVAEASRLALDRIDWNLFHDLAEVNATGPLVWKNLGALGHRDRVPAPLRARFEARAAAIREANAARLTNARELFARFAGRHIPVVILKGVLFAETIYRDPSYKKMNDVDILIRMHDLDAIYDIYQEMRFFSAAALVGGSPRRQEKFSHHAPPFFSRDLKLMVGTHWGLITPLAPYTIDYHAIWSRVVDVDFYGYPAKAMAPEDNLHHLCVHLPYYKCGLRELADIYNLVRHQPIDWDLFAAEMTRAKTENLVYHALSLAHRICPMPALAAAIARARPGTSSYFRHDAERKCASISRLLRGRSTHLSTIEKAYTDLQTTNAPVEKWGAYRRLWSGILFAPRQDVLKMNALEEVGRIRLGGARLQAPWRVYRVFARDVGGAIFVAILAKCAYDCLRATVTAPFAGPDSRRATFESFARDLGVSVAQLEQLKNALE